MYGVDWNAPLSTDGDAETVEIPSITNPLTIPDYLQLQEVVDPTSPNSADYGVDQYLQTVCFVAHKVSHY